MLGGPKGTSLDASWCSYLVFRPGLARVRVWDWILSVRIFLRERFTQDRRTQHKHNCRPKKEYDQLIRVCPHTLLCVVYTNTLGVPIYKGLSRST